MGSLAAIYPGSRQAYRGWGEQESLQALMVAAPNGAFLQGGELKTAKSTEAERQRALGAVCRFLGAPSLQAMAKTFHKVAR